MIRMLQVIKTQLFAQAQKIVFFDGITVDFIHNITLSDCDIEVAVKQHNWGNPVNLRVFHQYHLIAETGAAVINFKNGTDITVHGFDATGVAEVKLAVGQARVVGSMNFCRTSA